MEVELVAAPTPASAAPARESTWEALLEEERSTLERPTTARTILRSGIVRIVAVIVSLS